MFFNIKKLKPLFLFFLVVFACSGCEKDVVKEAFKGTYSAGRNNKIINEYCQSCHVHAGFVPDRHIDDMNSSYTKRLFRTTSECRTCHYLEENILGDTLRKHRRPDAANRGSYREFMKEEMERKQEDRK